MMEENSQKTSVMHYCRICKRGFGCGGALGGHMRAHGIADVNIHHNNNEEQTLNMISNFQDNQSQGNRHSYFLCTTTTTTTNRFMTCRLGEDCSKKFLSLNSFVDTLGDEAKIKGKGERGDASSEEEDLANCLVMLSNKNKASALSSDQDQKNKAEEEVKGLFQCKACKKVFNSHQALGGHRASHKKVKGCFAARFHKYLTVDIDIIDEDGTGTGIPLDELASASNNGIDHPSFDLNKTFQVPLFNDNAQENSKKQPKVHECSICHRVFSSGQALGGHKRCHWLSPNLPDTNFIPTFPDFQCHTQQFYKKPKYQKSENKTSLDLNFPPLFTTNIAKEAQNHLMNACNSFKFEVPTRIYLLPPKNGDVKENQERRYASLPEYNREEEKEECRIKLAKLNDLRDLKLDGVSTSWLHLGIVPSTVSEDTA